LVAGLTVPAFAQKAEIDAVNAKWIDFFAILRMTHGFL